MRPILVLVALVLVACSVDETGYLRRELIDQSGRDFLSTTVDGDVFVIGLAGAVGPAGGALTIANPRNGGAADAVVDAAAGSFAAVVRGRLGDRLVLEYEAGEAAASLELSVNDALDSLEPPACVVCKSVLVSLPEDGEVTVHLDEIDDPTPPFVIANMTRGTTREVATTTPPPRIPAEFDDSICAYRVDAAGERASTVECQLVPEP